MEKFLGYLFAFLIIALGIPNIGTCFTYIFERSGVIGGQGDLNKTELENSNCQGYSITYNLNDGVLVEVNPEYYTLFSDDITLNNPTKSGYEFLGWTGSNGDVPQVNITICTGSNGDLEFTANFIRVLDPIEVNLNGSMLIWNEDAKVEEYQIFINDSIVKCLNTCSIDVHELDEYFTDGNNEIYIKGQAEDYKTSISNQIDYVYYDLELFDYNVLNTVNFSRLSDRYVIVTGTVHLEYSYAGELILSVYKDKDVLNMTPEEAFLYGVNIHNDKAKLLLNNISMFDLVKYFDSLYDSFGDGGALVVDGKFVYCINDTLKTEYTPTSIYINVNYGEMYEESNFYEGVDLDISDCSSNNSFTVGFAGYSGDSNFLTEVMLTDIDGNVWNFCYYDLFEKNTTYFQIGNTEYSIAEINSVARELKFYLNENYYLKLRVNITVLIQDLYSYARTLRQEYEQSIGNTNPTSMKLWSYKDVNFTLNLNNYFVAYSNQDEEVTFSYDLFCEYKTTRYL